MEIKFHDFSPDKLLGTQGLSKDSVFITIPCYAEEDLMATLCSLDQCEKCGKVPVAIVLVNSPDEIDSEIWIKNRTAYLQAKNSNFESVTILPIHVYEIPKRIAGVGLARRMAMDTAHFLYEHLNKENQPILCLDADSTVKRNYLTEVVKFFKENPDKAAVSIHFEHPYDEEIDEVLKNGIIDYELHLRYFIEAQRWAGHPHAYQTIGSSMAVRSSDYKKQGGMNKRKAGEDFYFLHKFSRINALADLNSTTVYPAVRVSDRVPFGTGKALKDIADGQKFSTYSFRTFIDLKKIIDGVNLLKKGSGSDLNELFPATFLECFGGEEVLAAISDSKKNSSSPDTFEKRFYYWFDAFKVFKFAHYCRDHYYPNQEVLTAVNDFFDFTGKGLSFSMPVDALEYFRKIIENGIEG